MFQEGLPLRGVVNYGKYIVVNNFFAGKPIIEAYNISKELEFAACVLTTKASKQFNKTKEILQTKGMKLAIPSFLNYLVPMKKANQYMDVIRSRVFDCDGKEIKSKVKEAFGSHYKEIKNSTLKKLKNTVDWLIYLKNFDTKIHGAHHT